MVSSTSRFKNSPTLFGEQLAKDLESWEAPLEEGKLLQYVGDILIATRMKEACVVTWTQGIALGILAQDLGPSRRAVAYFSKQLDTTAKGWPGCLRAVAAVVLNIQEARKFTLGQKMTVFVSHTVSAGLEVKGGHWLSPQRFLKYQAIMVEQDDVEILVTNIINPASFLSGSQGEPVHHDCLETIEASYSSCLDLKDTPLDDAETWFTDGSSYVISGKRHAGYAVTTCRKVIESGPLPTDTSAQKAEIIALTCALEIAKGNKVNIYTDSRYAFGVVHAHGAIWKERGLLNSQGKNIKHSQEILRLLEAVQLPEQVAIMHIKAHQKVSSELEEGNKLADREAKEAAKGEITIEEALIPDGQVSLEAPVTSHQLVRSNYTMYHKFSPASIGMNLILVRQLMNHQDLTEILKEIQEKGQKTLVTVYHDGKEISKVLQRGSGHCYAHLVLIIYSFFGPQNREQKFGRWPKEEKSMRKETS
ncbi:hypothetical protein DUI87_25858 [Hirundo rustica rustica]|uniref:RNase H type-1 domain-containing protein n=1 Tax=Hirundo rustica rustica TaxID=333673 RepID=A0A3M0JRW2_HIRRU|nr:hypothetical protein DUI87_25858 [Hirundo rustica rustica]